LGFSQELSGIQFTLQNKMADDLFRVREMIVIELTGKAAIRSSKSPAIFASAACAATGEFKRSSTRRSISS